MHFEDYLKTFWNKTPGKGDNLVLEEKIWRKIHLRIKLKRISIAATAAAACIAIIIPLIHFSGRMDTPEEKTAMLAYAPETSTEIILPDGTKVWLDAGSTLSCPAEMESERTVSLKGSAAFDVVKTEDLRKFRIELESSFIEVKGTSFSVKDDGSKEISVVLYSGAIDFVSTSNGQTVALKPDNKLVFNIDQQSMLVTPAFQGISWKNGIYQIRNASLRSMVEFIEWRYGVDVNIAAELNDSQKINGQILQEDSCDTVLEKICFILDLKASKENGIYRIMRK